MDERIDIKKASGTASQAINTNWDIPTKIRHFDVAKVGRISREMNRTFVAVGYLKGRSQTEKLRHG